MNIKANPFRKKALIAKYVTLAGILAQIALIMLTTLWLVPEHKTPNPVICVLALLPIAILLPFILKNNIRAHIWLCFILLGYFLASVQNAFIPQYGFIPVVEIAVLIGLFTAAMLFARWQHKSENLTH